MLGVGFCQGCKCVWDVHMPRLCVSGMCVYVPGICVPRMHVQIHKHMSPGCTYACDVCYVSIQVCMPMMCVLGYVFPGVHAARMCIHSQLPANIIISFSLKISLQPLTRLHSQLTLTYSRRTGNGACLSYDFYYCDKNIMTKSNLGKKWFISLYTSR